LQSIGRGLRRSENKMEILIFDIADDIQQKNYTIKHFMERINIYNKEQFDYEINNVSLPKKGD